MPRFALARSYRVARTPLARAFAALLLAGACLIRAAGPASADAADSTAAPEQSAPAVPSHVATAAATSSSSVFETAPSLPPPRLSGYLQAREFYQDEVGATMLLNRVRFAIDGALPSKFSYRVLTEWQVVSGTRTPATVALREAIVKWTPGRLSLTGGEFKTPFTREYLIPVPDLELADLAVAVDSIAPKYDVGVMAEYALGASATLSAGVFNGEGANTTSNRDSSSLFVGRLAVRVLPQFSLGASATHEGGDSLRWGADASAQYLGAVVRAEYLTRHRDGRDRAQDDFGWYVFESFRVVPRIQAVARQEDFQRPAYGLARRVRGLAWGANVDVAPNRLKLLFEMSRRMTGRAQQHTDTWLAQAQARF